MPKLKTNKALCKRIKVTKTGKILRTRAGKSHLNSGMSPKRRRQLRRAGHIAQGFLKKIRRSLGSEALRLTEAIWKGSGNAQGK